MARVPGVSERRPGSEVQPCVCSGSTRSSTTRPRRSSSTGAWSRRGGGALQPAQARQAAGAVLRVGAARAVRRAGACRRPGCDRGDLDAVAYSFDPALCRPAAELGLDDPWDHLRVEYARRAPAFLADALPGLDPDRSASCRTTSRTPRPPASPRPSRDSACLVLDGRGERASPPGRRTTATAGSTALFAQELPHSLGLLYEDLTAHLGFLRSSDEYKVMALASYGKPRFAADLRAFVHATGDGGFVAQAAGLEPLRAAAPAGTSEMTGGARRPRRIVQRRLEEVVVELATLAARADRRAPARRWPAGRRSTAWRTPVLLRRSGRSRTSGCSPRPATPGRRSGRPCTWRRTTATVRSRSTTAALGRAWTDDELAARPAHRTAAVHDAGRPRRRGRRRCWPTTASSPGSPGAASSGPARWATARCWRTPATRTTWSG